MERSTILVTDPDALQNLIAVLQKEVLQLKSLQKQERDELRRRNKLLKTRVASTEAPLVNGKRSSRTLINSMKATEKRLMAESEVLELMRPNAIKNPVLIDLTLEKEFSEMLANLKTLIDLEEKQKSNLKLTLERLNIAIDRDRAILDKLMADLEEKRQQMDINPTERCQQRIHLLKTNVRKVKSCVTEIWTEMAEFLHTHFPTVPTMENGHDNLSISTMNGDTEDHPYIAMTDLIQKLMTAHMSKSGSPYLKIEDTWWPPYVKMLIKYGICVQHPQRPNEIRLESYS